MAELAQRPAMGDALPHQGDLIGPRTYMWLVGGLLILAVTYNTLLAIVNAHIVPLSRMIAATADGALIAGAALLALMRWRPEMTRWLMMIALFTALILLFSLGRGDFMPKDARDIVLIAAFAMLGLTASWGDARRILVVLHGIVLAVMVVEFTLPQLYGAIFDPAAYFINTRGFLEEQFYGADLFNAVRPDERYILPQLGLLRASSVFLEPVTFGNYCAFAMLMILAFWQDWSMRTRIVVAVSWCAVLIGSDSRFAGVSSIILLGVSPLLRRTPTTLAPMFLPIVLIVVAAASLSLGFNPLQDNFGGRLARGLRHIARLELPDLLGLGIATQALADAGIAYLIKAISLPGVLLLQLFVFLHPALMSPRQRLVIGGAALIFALNLLVSNSILSLKCGAPIWFLVGAVIALGRNDDDQPSASSG